MSEETPTRARPYPAALKEELADLNMKLDSLIKHWADAAEMTGMMTSITEAFQVTHTDNTAIQQQLHLLLTPIEVQAPQRWRRVLWLGVVVGAVLLSFWLGGYAPWVRTEERRLDAKARRLDAFLGDLHTTIEQGLSQLPRGVQQQLQDVYRTHKYEPLRSQPELKKP